MNRTDPFVPALPRELWQLIFSYLSQEQRVRSVVRVCRMWHGLGWSRGLCLNLSPVVRVYCCSLPGCSPPEHSVELLRELAATVATLTMNDRRKAEQFSAAEVKELLPPLMSLNLRSDLHTLRELAALVPMRRLARLQLLQAGVSDLKALPALQQLTHLDLCFSKKLHLDNTVAQLHLTSMRALRSLSLRVGSPEKHMRSNPDAQQLLAFAALPWLESLKLAIFAESRLMLDHVEPLRSLTRLRALSLVCVDGIPFRALEDVFASLPQLARIRLSDYSWHPLEPAKLVNPHVTSLHFGRAHVEEVRLHELLAQFPSLSKLKLGARVASDEIHSLPDILTSLDLNGRATNLFNLYHSLKNLRHLSLQDREQLEHLHLLPNLVSLRVKLANLGGGQQQAFAHSIRRCRTLTRLHFEDCSFATAIAFDHQYLGTLPNLRTLEITGCHLAHAHLRLTSLLKLSLFAKGYPALQVASDSIWSTHFPWKSAFTAGKKPHK